MGKWNSGDMKEIILKHINNFTIHVGEGGHWSDEITVDISDETLFLGGFRTDEVDIDETFDCDIEYLYLSDTSGDGLKSKNKKVREVYFAIKDELEELGYEVVDCYKNYF